MTLAGVGSVGSEPPPLDRHFDTIIRGLTLGHVTPVLGAGANLCGRPPSHGEDWLYHYPPSGQELASYLARSFKFPVGEPAELLRVSQWIYAMKGGSGPLYDTLHQLFDADYPVTPLHDFLASIPGAVRSKLKEKGIPRPYKPPLIVTTNYDDLMESALTARGEPFEVVVYMAEGPHTGHFCRCHPGEEPEEIVDADKNVELDPDERTVLLKIHGDVDRDNPDEDSYVITEDHYIEYLTRLDLDSLVPVKVLRRLRRCHFVFLGYSMRDWNLRAILYRLWLERRNTWAWWAVQLHPDPLECESWARRNVAIFDLPLDEYLAELKRRFDEGLEELP